MTYIRLAKPLQYPAENPPPYPPIPKKKNKDSTIPLPAASGGYHLARPSNIYAESKAEVFTSIPSAEKPVSASDAAKTGEDISDLQMQLVEKEHSSGGYAVSRPCSVTFVH